MEYEENADRNNLHAEPNTYTTNTQQLTVVQIFEILLSPV